MSCVETYAVYLLSAAPLITVALIAWIERS